MKTSIIYLRVSRERDGEKELSIQSQMEQCEEKAESLHANVLEVFSDRDKSGRKNNRPGYQQAISYCESMKVDYFIVWSTSRFARSIIDAKNDKLRLDRVGTKVKYVTLDFEEDTNAGFLVLSVSEIMDEYQSRQIGVDTKRSMMKNANDGYFNGGRVSFGFMVIKDIHDARKRRLAVDADESVVVKKIFNMRKTGLGGKTIADCLNKEGISYRSKSWTKTRVTALLRNEKVMGISVFNQRNHEGVLHPEKAWVRVKSHDAIIEIQLWEKVQAMMNDAINPKEKGSPNSNHLFTGLLKCGCCNLNLKACSGTSRNGNKYYYYTCPNRKNGMDCTQKPVRTDLLDNWLINELQTIVFTPKNLKTITDEVNKESKNWKTEKQKLKNQTAKELKLLKIRTDKLYDHVENPDFKANLNDIFPRITENNKKIEKLKTKQQKIKELYSPKNLEIKPEEFSEFLSEKIINGSDPRTKRTFIQSFLQGLTLKDGQLNIEYNPVSLLRSNELRVPSRKDWLLDLGSNQGQTD